MSWLHTICNIKTIMFHRFHCSHPISFSFLESFPSALSTNVTDASFRNPLWPSLRKFFTYMTLSGILSCQTFWHDLYSYSMYYKTDLQFHPCIVCYKFVGDIIYKTLIVTVQTMVNLKSASNHCAGKYRSLSYIIANFASSFTTFYGT